MPKRNNKISEMIKESIIDAAEKILSHNENTTMEELAKEAGVTKKQLIITSKQRRNNISHHISWIY